MYKVNKANRTSLNVNNSNEGETLEQKIDRVVNNREPITDGAPIIFTERKNGVEAAYNIRTDRFEIALDAMTSVAKTHIGRREEKLKEKEAKIIEMKKNENGGAETTQGTN